MLADVRIITTRESALVALFLQIFLEEEKLLRSCQALEHELTSTMLQLLEHADIIEFEATRNCMVLHEHRLSFVYNLLGNTEMGDWAQRLRPLIGKESTRYQYTIPIGIRVACSLYKLAHAAEYLQCSEMFAVGNSVVHFILHEFVFAVKVIFKSQMKWPEGDDLQNVMCGFQDLCGLPSVQVCPLSMVQLM